MSPIDVFSEGLAPVITNIEQKVNDPLKGRLFDNQSRGLVFMDNKGTLITTALDYLCYKYMSGFREGFAIIRFESLAEGKTSFVYMNKQGTILPFAFNYATPFYRGFAVVKSKNDQFQIINSQFEVIYTLPYADVSAISEGLIAVKDEMGKYGYIDLNFKLIIPHKYEIAEPFTNGISKVMFQGKSGYINTFGVEFWTN